MHLPRSGPKAATISRSPGRLLSPTASRTDLGGGDDHGQMFRLYIAGRGEKRRAMLGKAFGHLCDECDRVERLTVIEFLQPVITFVPSNKADQRRSLHPRDYAVNAATSYVQTRNALRTCGPNEFMRGMSVASRPRATTILPIRGVLLRGSKMCHSPSRKTSIQALKSIGSTTGTPMSPR